MEKHKGHRALSRTVLSFLLFGVLVATYAWAQVGRADDKGGGATGDGGSTSASSKGKDKGSNQAKDSASGASQSSSNGPFESQMLAYGAVDQIAREFVSSACDKVKDEKGKLVSIQVVLYDATSFASIPIYAAFATNISLLKDQYDAIQKQLSGGAGAAGAVMDVASLVLQYSAASTTETASSISVSDSAIRMSLAHYFTAAPKKRLTRCEGDNVTVVFRYPALGSQVTSIEAARKNTVSDLDGLLKLKVSVQEGLKKAIAAKKILADDELAKKLPEINKLYDQLITSLNTADPNTGIPAIVGILQGRAIFDLIVKGDSYIVYEEAVAGGGTQKDRKNLFTNVFWGDLISYSGGAIINLAMVNGANSEIVLANTVRMRTDFTRIAKPVDDASSKSGDNLSSLKP